MRIFVLSAMMAFTLLAGTVSTASAFEIVPRQGECRLDDPAPVEEVLLEARGSTLVLTHRDALLSCCLEYFVRATLEGSVLELVEEDRGPICRCLPCRFDVAAEVVGLEPGTYSVVVHALGVEKPVTAEIEIERFEGFAIEASQVWAKFGQTGVRVPVIATHEKPLSGFSFGTTWPLEHVRLADMSIEDTVTELVGAEYVGVTMQNDATDVVDDVVDDVGLAADGRGAAAGTGWAVCVVILDNEEPSEAQTIPVGSGQCILNLVYDILLPQASVPRSVSVPLVGGLGKPPVSLLFLIGGKEIEPAARSGIIQLSYPPTFLRGDSNDDAIVNLADPIYLLNHLFLSGPRPPCDDAADGQDDGTLDLSDAVGVLSYLFLGGSIPPPLPSDPPSFDPTSDTLGCARA